VSLKDYPTVTTTLAFKIHLGYTCGRLYDRHPNGYWENPIPSTGIAYIDGGPLVLRDIFMFSRSEMVKFKDLSIPRTKKELICGRRKMYFFACSWK